MTGIMKTFGRHIRDYPHIILGVALLMLALLAVSI